MHLHPKNLPIIDGFTCAILGTFVVKYGVLPRYHSSGLVTEESRLRINSDLI